MVRHCQPNHGGQGPGRPGKLDTWPMNGEHGVSTIGVSDYFLHFLSGCLPDWGWQLLHDLELAGDPFSGQII